MIRRSLVSLLVLLLAACTGEPPTTRPTVRASRSPAVAVASKAPVEESSMRPSTLASRVPVALATAPALSHGPTVALTGKVKLEGSFLAAAGFGHFSSDGSYLELKSGSLIANNGSSLISDSGGTILSNNGGSLISDHAAALRQRRVLADAPAAGDLVPVKGMLVAAVSLLDGQALGPSVFTDASGGYTLAIPAEAAGNFVVVAGVPAERLDDPVLHDPRAQFAVVTSLAHPEPAVDADTALVGKYLRRAMVSRLREVALTTDDASLESLILGTATPPEEMKVILIDGLKIYRDAAQAAGIAAMTPDAQLLLTQRVSDALLSTVDITGIQVGKALVSDWIGPDEPAVPAMVSVIRTVRRRAAENLASDPQFFARQDYLAEANVGREADPYQILRPSDVTEFMLDAYLLHNDPKAFTKVENVFDSMGFIRSDPGNLSPERHRLRGASSTIGASMLLAIAGDTNGARTAMIAAMDTPPASPAP